MQIHVFDDAATLGHEAALIVSAALQANPHLKLGLPTGSTPLGMYAELARLHREEGLSFAKALAFNLDEYVGLTPSSPQSYSFFMEDNLFRHIDLPAENRHIPTGISDDPEAEAARYDALLAANAPLDLLILGIGTNGHVGFNEPGSPWDSPCRVVALSEETIVANARFFTGEGETVPSQAITMGMAAILNAKQILLLATGSSKAQCIDAALKGEPTVEVPASALQNHPNLIVLLDKAAASLLD